MADNGAGNDNRRLSCSTESFLHLTLQPGIEWQATFPICSCLWIMPSIPTRARVDIYIVRTDSSLQHIQDTATVTSGANSHFADIWASSVPGTGVKLKPTRVAANAKSGPVEYYSISGRRVFVAANEKSGRIFGRLSTGVYITVGAQAIAQQSGLSRQ